MLRTARVRAVLIDPLVAFDLLPEAVLHLFPLWAQRLDPDEMHEVDFVTSYFALLADLQAGLVRSPLAKMPPERYLPFVALFPRILPALLGKEDAVGVIAIWRDMLGKAKNVDGSLAWLPRKDTMPFQRLAIFDFDGTLFGSPERPEWWPTQGFWGRLETLSTPFVPEVPGPEWWSASVVEAARSAIADGCTHTVLLTGRIPKFERRVRAMLEGQGLTLDEHCFASGSSTLPFKIGVIERLCTEHPEAQVVEMWDDRPEHAPEFEAAIRRMGRTPVIHTVKRLACEFAHRPEGC